MKDFNTRHDVWLKMLTDGEMKKLMVEDTYTPVKQYFDVFEQEFVPAVKSGDRIKNKEISKFKFQ